MAASYHNETKFGGDGIFEDFEDVLLVRIGMVGLWYFWYPLEKILWQIVGRLARWQLAIIQDVDALLDAYCGTQLTVICLTSIRYAEALSLDMHGLMYFFDAFTKIFIITQSCTCKRHSTALEAPTLKAVKAESCEGAAALSGAVVV